ncbi:MAG: hypothetical protein HQL63_05835 [Magnetococcales bacterium]|nr:hypothetical protein [Magnetococcales bacterium]MBF0322013.1 hypothetical protein [Magnetococcales bacterium]
MPAHQISTVEPLGRSGGFSDTIRWKVAGGLVGRLLSHAGTEKNVPTSTQLMDPDFRREFSARVAKKAMQSQGNAVELNHGLTEQEILARIKQGSDIEFDYKRLLEEANKYA